MVTPLRFRAVTSNPSGKCRSIFLTGGVVSIFLSMSLSSTVVGDVLIFLYPFVSRPHGSLGGVRMTRGPSDLPPRRLRILGDLQLNSLSLCALWIGVSKPARLVRRCRTVNVPRSLMFMTPVALELARRCLESLDSLDAAASMPWTAESTLLSGSDMLAGFGGAVAFDQLKCKRRCTETSERVSNQPSVWIGEDGIGIGAISLPLETRWMSVECLVVLLLSDVVGRREG